MPLQAISSLCVVAHDFQARDLRAATQVVVAHVGRFHEQLQHVEHSAFYSLIQGQSAQRRGLGEVLGKTKAGAAVPEVYRTMASVRGTHKPRIVVPGPATEHTHFATFTVRL